MLIIYYSLAILIPITLYTNSSINTCIEHTQRNNKQRCRNNSVPFKQCISSFKTVRVWPSDPLFIHLSVCPFVIAMAGGQLMWRCGRPPFGVRASVNVPTGFVKFFPHKRIPVMSVFLLKWKREVTSFNVETVRRLMSFDLSSTSL